MVASNGFNGNGHSNGFNGNGHGNGNGFNGNGNGVATGSPSATGPPSPDSQRRVIVANKGEADADYIAMFEKLKIEPIPTELQSKLPLGTHDQTSVVSSYTNVYPLKTQSVPVYLYHLEFTRRFTRNGESFERSTTPPEERKLGDYFLVRSRDTQRQLLRRFVGKYPAVFGETLEVFCYDYQHCLFSLIELAPPKDVMVLAEKEIAPIYNTACSVTLDVKVPQNNVFNIKDFKESLAGKISEKDDTVVRFLEMATSHYATEKPEEHLTYESKRSYFLALQKYGFDEQKACPSLGEGKYLAIGANKTVVRTEQSNDPAIVVDSKKTPFLASMNMLEMACLLCKANPSAVINNVQLEKLRRVFKNVVVFPYHLPHMNFSIYGLSDNDANTEKFTDQEGKPISVADYFAQKYQTQLQQPQWPLVIRKEGSRMTYFPMELLHVADNQRVGKNNITPADIAVIVKACAVPPVVKQDDCHKAMLAFNIHNDGFCKNASIEINHDPLLIQGKVLKAPQISYKQGGLNPESNGKWRLPKQAQYVSVKSSDIAWSSIFMRVRGENFNAGHFKQFVDRYERECKIRGITFAQNQGIFEFDDNERDIDRIFSEAAQGGCKFMLIGHSDRDTNFHTTFKLYERRYHIITQCVRVKTMGNVLNNKMLALENIVAKTNVKLGGLNYDIKLQDPNFRIAADTLFIGLGMNHPGGITKHDDVETNNLLCLKSRSVLGFAANDGELPSEFIGNFFFQPPRRDEKISVLDEIFEETCTRYKANRKTTPKHIVLYRSGCSEGQFAHILSHEVTLFKKLIETHARGAYLSVIIPSKTHSIRFFKDNIDPRARSDDQNIRPGSLFDTAVINSTYNEFYLNSHLAIQGTAKTPKYTVLYTNFPGVTMADFERWTNALCYDFQIVTSPTSLPAPVYIANRYAERGRDLINASELSRVGHKDEEAAEGNPAKSPLYNESLKLNYTEVAMFRDKRINA